MAVLSHFHRLTKVTVLAFVLVAPVFAGVIPLFNPSKKVTQENLFFLQSSTFLANDPFSLKTLLLSEMKGALHSRDGNNVAMAIERADVGYSHHKYGYIGFTFREEIFIDASKDAVDLIYLATNKKDLPVGKRFDLAFRIKAYQMQGLMYANNFTVYKQFGWNVNIGAGVEALYATEMQDGYVNGYAVAVSQKDYSFSGVSYYNYTHNYLYDLDVNPSSAYGYTTHFSLVVTKENFSVTLLANDIFSELDWTENPYSEVYLQSDNKEYDEDGYVKYNPTVWGKEGYEEYKQKLVKKYRVVGSYLYKHKWFYSLGSDYVDSFYLPFVSVAYHFTKDESIAIGYETRFRSFSITSQYKGFLIGIKTDDFFQPSTLGLSLGVNF